MTPSQLTGEFRKRFQTPKDPIPEHFLNDLSMFCNRFTESDIGKIFQGFVESYEYTKLPKIGKLYKIAEGLQITPKATSTGPYFAYKCVECETLYDMESSGCPKCRELTEIEIVIVKSEEPMEYVALQNRCYECNQYNDLSMGAGCSQYPNHDNSPVCRECDCRKCCISEKQYRIGNRLMFMESRDRLFGFWKRFDPAKKNVTKPEFESKKETG